MKYSCRASPFQPSHDHELEADQLVRRGPSGAAYMRFADIAEITVFKERRFGSSRTYRACTIAGDTPFIKEFERRALANPPRPRFIEDEFRETLGTVHRIVR